MKTLKEGENTLLDNSMVFVGQWLSLMDRMGVSVERHGDSTGRLPALSL